MPTQPDDIALYAQMDPLLGTRPDPAVAATVRASIPQVKARRKALGIAPYLRAPPPAAAPVTTEPPPLPAPPTSSVVVRRRSTGGERSQERIHTPAPPPPTTALPAEVPAPAERTHAASTNGARPAARTQTASPAPAPKRSTPAPAKTPSPAPSATAPRRRKTRLEAYLHLLGVRPDGEVAELAGVTRDNVRAFRKRHGIASQEAPTSAPTAPPAPEPPPVQVSPAPATTTRVKGKPGRKSPVEAHLAELGTLPDAEIAKRAGVSVAAVVQYRRRRRIPAWVEPAAIAPAPAQEVASESAMAVAADAPLVEAPVVGAELQAYRVDLQKDGERRVLFVVAEDIVEAVTRTVRGLEARGALGWSMQRVKRVGAGVG